MDSLGDLSAPVELLPDELRRLRVWAQGLDPRAPAAAPVEAAARMGGAQAQDSAAAALSLRLRTAGVTHADVDTAVAAGELVRTWAMRGTLHLFARDDLGWARAATAPAQLPAVRRWLDKRDALVAAERALRDVGAILAADGPLTRRELVRRLAAQGHPDLDYVAFGLLRLAAYEGVACCGPDRGRYPTYVAWPAEVDPLDLAAARRELVRRHVFGFAPVAPADTAAWAGLPLRDVREGWEALEDELVEVRVGERRLWAPRAYLDVALAGAAAPAVRLAPSWDTYLLGYRGRDDAIDPRFADRLLPGGGWFNPVILVDGWAVALWRLRKRGKRVEIEVEPFARLSRAIRDGIAAEADDLARFLGTPLRVA